VELRYDTVYHSRVSYWINKIFLPKSSAVAELAIEFLSKNQSSAVKESIERENNPIVAGRFFYGLVSNSIRLTLKSA
jgi:hypothetical protein